MRNLKWVCKLCVKCFMSVIHFSHSLATLYSKADKSVSSNRGTSQKGIENDVKTDKSLQVLK